MTVIESRELFLENSQILEFCNLNEFSQGDQVGETARLLNDKKNKTNIMCGENYSKKH